VQRGPNSGMETRYTMLETVREYGLERLEATGEEPATRDMQASWCLNLAARAEIELAGPEQAAWLQRLEADLANFRAAHDWLLDTGDATSALRLGGALGWFWSSAPHLDEGRQRIDALMAMPGVEQTPAALAKVLATAGDIADWQGDQPRARAHYERALTIYRGLGDLQRVASMLRGLGSSAIDRAELGLAQELLEESLSLAHETGDGWETAAATNLLGVVASVHGDIKTALARHSDAAAAWRRLGDAGHVVTALTSVGWIALLAGDLERAIPAYREALKLAVTSDDEWYRAWCAIGAGGIAAGRGEWTLAALLIAAGRAEQQRLSVVLRPHNEAALARIVEAVRTELGTTEFTLAWEAGRALSNASLTNRAQAFLDAAATAIARAPGFDRLTARERHVLRLLTQGQSDKEIAGDLFVTRRTASKHVSSVLAKLGVPSRGAAVAVAKAQDLL
jgi:DNA-binding CsgD family transcriptional regulator